MSEQPITDLPFVTEPLNHLHLLVRADIKTPECTPEFIEDWLTRLVAAVGMKVLIPARAIHCDTDGNEGVTGIVCLETSHASIHVWEDGYLQFDLYSCKEFSTDAVLDLFQPFEPQRIDFTLVDRNHSGGFVATSGYRLFNVNMNDMDATLARMNEARQSNPRLGRLTEEHEPITSLTEATRTDSAPEK